jgi:hypothetical protein
MVSFRLSEEEYESLRHICMTVGARSLSDVARDAVHQLIGAAAAPKNDLEAQLRMLNERVDVLDHEVRHLAGLVREGDTTSATFDAAN